MHIFVLGREIVISRFCRARPIFKLFSEKFTRVPPGAREFFGLPVGSPGFRRGGYSRGRPPGARDSLRKNCDSSLSPFRAGAINKFNSARLPYVGHGYRYLSEPPIPGLASPGQKSLVGLATGRKAPPYGGGPSARGRATSRTRNQRARRIAQINVERPRCSLQSAAPLFRGGRRPTTNGKP